jgi:hypothetical protein
MRVASSPQATAAAPLQPQGSEALGPKYITLPTTQAIRGAPVRFHADQVQSIPVADDRMAIELVGNVTLLQTRLDGDYLEIQSERAVVFTSEKAGGSFQEVGNQNELGNQVTGAYLEGDVRINYTPAKKTAPEQRLLAQRVFYDFVGNRAVLTDAILRSTDPTTQVPITVRAQTLRQLSAGEYRGEGVEMSTSSFATPTYSVKADQVYIREDEVPVVDQGGGVPATNGQTQTLAYYVAQNDTLRMWDVPVFYTPRASGVIDQSPFPLLGFGFSQTKRFGFGMTSDFGPYELMGLEHPPGLDVSILSDFFSKRGPATGLNAEYAGANLDQDSKDLTDYSGLFKSFIITDHGVDEFGENRSDVTPPDQVRGSVLWEHQQFFPDYWQAQLRLGYASDSTFLEEYFPKDFYEDQPYDAEAYLKRQQDTEAITFLAEGDTNHFVTTSDQQQEQFDVEQLPQLGYHRIGDSLFGDDFTFYSDNSLDRLRFDKSRYSLNQQGFITVNPGLPSEGYTGTTSSPVDRGDTKQELDYPMQIGQIKVVPYALGELTAYSASPENDGKQRLFGAAGVRITTDFWKVDDTVQSDLFDLNRIRHVIEPEINLYTSGETVDRSQLYIYDENVDGISDVSAADIALHQRWETYRGAPGKQQSVAFLTWNVSADMYTNPPKDPGNAQTDFRGIFFPSDVAASIPRDAINSDVTWLVSDSTAVLADESYNVDHAKLATASVGIAGKDYDRFAYYLGLRYIEPLNSDLATFAVQYELTAKYEVEYSQSYDFGQNKNANSEVTLRRKFDVLTAEVSVFHDSASGDSGATFNVYPTGLGPTNSNPDINSFFNNK